MRRRAAVILSFALMLIALPAGAGPSLRVHGFYYEAPNVGPFADAVGFTAVGIGAELGMGIEGPWGVYVGGGLGWGGHEFTDVAGSTERTKLRAWYVRAGMDYHVAVGEADVYGGPALFWSSSRRGHESPVEPFHELEPYAYYGFEARAGGMVPLGPKWLDAFGEFSLMVGRGKIEDDHHFIGTIAAWTTSPAFRGGLSIAP